MRRHLARDMEGFDGGLNGGFDVVGSCFANHRYDAVVIRRGDDDLAAVRMPVAVEEEAEAAGGSGCGVAHGKPRAILQMTMLGLRMPCLSPILRTRITVWQLPRSLPALARARGR